MLPTGNNLSQSVDFDNLKLGSYIIVTKLSDMFNVIYGIYTNNNYNSIECSLH